MCEDSTSAWERRISCHVSVQEVAKLTDGSWLSCSDDTYRIQLVHGREGQVVSSSTVVQGEVADLHEVDLQRDQMTLIVTRKKYLHRFTVGRTSVLLSSIPGEFGLPQRLELPLATSAKSPSMGGARFRSLTRLHVEVSMNEVVCGDILCLLPSELASRVASFFDVKSLVNGLQVSKEWARMVSDDSLWHQRYRESFSRASVVPLNKLSWRDRFQHAKGFQTFSAAVAASGSSDRIILQPAKYQAGFAIRHFTTISGDQSTTDEAIHLEGGGCPAALYWPRDGGRVEDLRAEITDCQYGFYFASPEGSVRILRCQLTASAAPGMPLASAPLGIIQFSGTKGDLVVMDCEISGGEYAGIIFRHLARGLLKNCRIHSTGGCGVVIGNAASPTIRGNIIEKCRVGVRYHDGAAGLMDANSVLSCVKCGIKVDGESQVTISSTVVRQCIKSGLVIKGRGCVTSMGNDVSHNGSVGVLVSDAAHIVLTNTRIHSQRLLVEKGSTARMESSQVYDNVLAGIEVRSAGTLVVKNCEVKANGTAGLYSHSGAHVHVEHSEFHGHQRTCIRVLNSCTVAVFRYSHIHHNQSNAIFLSKGAIAVIDRNVLAFNARGIHVVGCCAQSFIVRNLIKSNSRAGVIVSNEGCATFQANTIVGNIYSNVLIKTGSFPSFIGNDVVGGGKRCVSVSGSGGLFLRNRIRTACSSAFTVVGSFCVFQDNTVTKSGGSDLLQAVSSGWWFGAMPQREPLEEQLRASPLLLR